LIIVIIKTIKLGMQTTSYGMNSFAHITDAAIANFCDKRTLNQELDRKYCFQCQKDAMQVKDLTNSTHRREWFIALIASHYFPFDINAGGVVTDGVVRKIGCYCDKVKV